MKSAALLRNIAYRAVTIRSVGPHVIWIYTYVLWAQVLIDIRLQQGCRSDPRSVLSFGQS